MTRSTASTRSGGTLCHIRTAAGVTPHSAATAFQSLYMLMWRMVASQGGFRAAGVPKIGDLRQALLVECRSHRQQT